MSSKFPSINLFIKSVPAILLSFTLQYSCNAGVRRLQFPTDASYGEIYAERGPIVLKQLASISKYEKMGRRLGPAQGSYAVYIRPGEIVEFEPNARCYRKPQVLSQFEPNSIDSIRISFTSLDNSEDDLCDNFFSHINNLKYLKILIAKSSDLSDKGFAKVDALRELKEIDLSGTLVSAASVKRISKFHSLQSIALSDTNLEGSDFSLLSRLPVLKKLYIHGAQLNDSDLHHLVVPRQADKSCLLKNFENSVGVKSPSDPCGLTSL